MRLLGGWKHDNPPAIDLFRVLETVDSLHMGEGEFRLIKRSVMWERGKGGSEEC